MPVTNDYFRSAPEKEFFEAMCGERLGGGMSRDVWSSVLDPSVVIKFETDKGHFQNVMEWEVWQEVKETKWAKWFAPCVSISGTGSVLIQKRTKVVSNRDKYPVKMPVFLGDFKYSNYGLFKGQMVAHDYGRCRLMTEGLTDRMKKVDWWADLDDD
jgi:hypothetical protein